MEMTLPTRAELEQLHNDLYDMHKRAKAMEASYRYLHDRADDEPWLDVDANLIEQTADNIQASLYHIERILQDEKNYPFTSPLLQR